MLAGSGKTLGDASTPVRKAIGGRLVVLPLSPQARKLKVSVVAVAVRFTEV